MTQNAQGKKDVYEELPTFRFLCFKGIIKEVKRMGKVGSVYKRLASKVRKELLQLKNKKAKIPVKKKEQKSQADVPLPAQAVCREQTHTGDSVHLGKHRGKLPQDHTLSPRGCCNQEETTAGVRRHRKPCVPVTGTQKGAARLSGKSSQNQQ